MKTADRHSKIGDHVKVADPKTGKQVTGTVRWVSPTRGTIEIELADKRRAYEYPEFDGTYPPQTPRKPWCMAVTNFKGTVEAAQGAK